MAVLQRAAAPGVVRRPAGPDFEALRIGLSPAKDVLVALEYLKHWPYCLVHALVRTGLMWAFTP